MKREWWGIGYLMHPVPVLAVCVMAFNDHYLKWHYASWWTGKLSDFMGVFFLPLLLCALYSLLMRPRQFIWIGSPLILYAIALTDLVFVAIKTSAGASHVYVSALGAVGFPSQNVCDASDLLALAMNPLTYMYAKIKAAESESCT